MPKGTLAQRVFNNLCQWKIWPKDPQQLMPMGTLAQGSLTTQCSMYKTLYTFQPHVHAFGTQCSHKTPMFQLVFFTNHTIIISTPIGNKTYQILFKSQFDIHISNDLNTFIISQYNWKYLKQSKHIINICRFGMKNNILFVLL
jgi:hypothetical protein